MRQGNQWTRVGSWGGYNYIKSPANGKTPHEYIRGGRKVRAVMIMQKGTKASITWKQDKRGYPRPTVITPDDGNWISYTSNDACGQQAYKSRYIQSPGEWNVYVSKKAYDASEGFYIDGTSRDRWASLTGTTFTFGIIDEFYGGFTEDGCSPNPGEGHPIREEEFLMSMTYEGKRNAKGGFASYTMIQKDEWGNKKVNTVTPKDGFLQGQFWAMMKPANVPCAWVR